MNGQQRRTIKKLGKLLKSKHEISRAEIWTPETVEALIIGKEFTHERDEWNAIANAHNDALYRISRSAPSVPSASKRSTASYNPKTSPKASPATTGKGPMELQRDCDRLNFLDECNRKLNRECGTVYGWEMILSRNVTRLMLESPYVSEVAGVDLNDSAVGKATCREVIDEAMERIKRMRASVGRATDEQGGLPVTPNSSRCPITNKLN